MRIVAWIVGGLIGYHGPGRDGVLCNYIILS